MGKGKAVSSSSFENYEIISNLGSGAFSNVFLARQLSTGQKVAIKVLKLDDHNEADNKETRIVRFKREMKLCADLYHVNIVKVLDFGKTLEGSLFTVFEYVPGQTLGQILKNEGALSVNRTFKILSQVLAAISCAHDQNVIHRDIKPDNIMISTDGTDSAKLLDFGISTFTSEDSDTMKITLTQDFLGTPAYASPEQVRGESISNKVDIFAWGLIFIECLTGENAYNETNKAKLLQKQLSKAPLPIPASLRGSSLGDFLTWILQKDPQRRAGNTSEVLKRFNLISPASIPQNGGFLKASDKTVHELVNLDSTKFKSLNRRKISTLICELKLKTAEHSESSEYLDYLFFESFELCRTLAENNGAYMAANSGGRLVLYFGYPSPGDFHARSAAKTALDISSTLAQTQKSLLVSNKAHLSWKISIHTGVVTVRKSVQSDEVFGTFLGESSDLCSRAPENEIIASPSIYDRLKKSFNLHELEGQTNIYRLTGMREVQSLFSRYKNEQLHGRNDELQKLEAIRLRSLNEGQAVMIKGEAGIGKSRFMAESVTTTSIERSAIYELLCYPENRNSALAPFLDFLKKYFKIGEFTSQELCSKSIIKELENCSFNPKEYLSLMYYWMGIESTEYPPLEIAPKMHKDLFLELTGKLFLEHILEAKSTLIFDDLHWADPTSLELLSMMLDKISQFSCIILMSARPEFIEPWNTKLISLIELEGLHENEVSSMIRSRLDQSEIPTNLIETVIQKVDGNPLFAEEIINSIISDDRSFLSERDVPDTLRELFSSRLDRIGEAKLTAQLASVIGRKFDYELLKAIHTKDEGVLLADLTQLLAAGIIHVVPRSDTLEYVFHHALVCDNAYESMSRETCESIHRSAAEALEKSLDDNSEFNPVVRELARHYLKCQDYSKALSYQYQAGKQVLRLSAYREAIEYFETALSCIEKLSELDQKLEVDIRIKLGVCLKTVFGWNDLRAIEEYDRIMALSENNSNVNMDELAPIIFGRWAAVMMTMKFKDALKLAEQYLSLAKSAGDQEVLMQAHLTVSNNLYWIGHITEAIKHCDQSLEFHKGLSSSSLIDKVGYEPVTMVFMLKIWCSWNVGKLNETEVLLQEYIKFTESLNHPFSQAIMMQTAACHYFHTADVNKCLEYSVKLVEVSNKYNLVFYEGVGLLFKGWSLAKQGDYELGIQLINDANLNYINPDNGKFMNSLCSCALADVLLESGQNSKAKNVLENALEIAIQSNEMPYITEIYRLLAEEAVCRNNLNDALQFITKSIDLCTEQKMLANKLKSSLDFATIKLMSDDESGIHALITLLDEFGSEENSPELLEARQLVSELN